MANQAARETGLLHSLEIEVSFAGLAQPQASRGPGVNIKRRRKSLWPSKKGI